MIDDRMLGQHGGVSQVNIGERALTMVCHASLDESERIVVLDVRHELSRHQFPLQGLDLSNLPDAEVYEVICTLSPNRRNDDDLGLAVNVNTFQSHEDYLQEKEGHLFQGELSPISGVSNVHSAANVMMNSGWQDADRHRELFNAISTVLFPLRWVINRNNAQEVGFHSLYCMGCFIHVIIQLG